MVKEPKFLFVLTKDRRNTSSFQYMSLSFSASHFHSDIPIFLCCFLTSHAFVKLINSSFDSFITKKYIL
jgi:hypothetical protein